MIEEEQALSYRLVVLGGRRIEALSYLNGGWLVHCILQLLAISFSWVRWSSFSFSWSLCS